MFISARTDKMEKKVVPFVEVEPKITIIINFPSTFGQWEEDMESPTAYVLPIPLFLRNDIFLWEN